MPPISSPLDPNQAPVDLCRPASTDVKHVYYLLGFKADAEKLGMSRDVFIRAMGAEGLPLVPGGYEPVYLLPMYQQQIAFGTKGLPFTGDYYDRAGR